MINSNEKIKRSWPKQAAVLLSDSSQMQLLLREMLRPEDWSISEVTPLPDKALQCIESERAFLIICNDVSNVPAVRSLRYLLTNPVGLCTPVLTLLSETRKQDASAISRMHSTVIVEKPLTPINFSNAFRRLIQIWESPPYILIRKIGNLLVSSQFEAAEQLLKRGCEISQVRLICSQILALVYKNQRKTKDAERVLLQVLKEAPTHLGLIISLANIYMLAAMPKMAHNLLQTAHQKLGNEHILRPDLYQASMLMGRMDAAIEHLYAMYHIGFTDDETVHALAKLLYSEARFSEVKRILNSNKSYLKKLSDAWGESVSQGSKLVG